MATVAHRILSSIPAVLSSLREVSPLRLVLAAFYCRGSLTRLGLAELYWRVRLCYQFYHYRFYQFGPDSSVIGLISFVPPSSGGVCGFQMELGVWSASEVESLGVSVWRLLLRVWGLG